MDYVPSELHIFIIVTGKRDDYVIGVGRFRILGGQGIEYWEAKGWPNSQQAHDVVTRWMQCNDVASTPFRRHVPTRSLINQCQIITFLILKSEIENSRIELRGIVLPVPSNQIKATFIVKPVLVATSIKQATCIKQACIQFPKQANMLK